MHTHGAQLQVAAVAAVANAVMSAAVQRHTFVQVQLQEISK
jgi:hypothetical protein